MSDMQSGTTAQPTESSGGSGTSSGGGQPLNLKLLRALTEVLGPLEDYPAGAPEGFELVYAEMEGTVAGQTVQATYEEEEWSLSLAGSAASEDEDEETEQEPAESDTAAESESESTDSGDSMPEDAQSESESEMSDQQQ